MIKLRINSEQKKWPLRKASCRWQKWRFVEIGCILHGLISKIVSRPCQTLSIMDKLNVAHCFELRSATMSIASLPDWFFLRPTLVAMVTKN